MRNSPKTMVKSPRKATNLLHSIPVYAPTVSGILIFVFGNWLLDFDFSGSMESNPSRYLISTSIFLFLYLYVFFTGVLVIIQKEVPRWGLPSIKGVWAVAQGILVLVVTGAAIISLLRDFFGFR